MEMIIKEFEDLPVDISQVEVGDEGFNFLSQRGVVVGVKRDPWRIVVLISDENCLTELIEMPRSSWLSESAHHHWQKAIKAREALQK